MADLAFEVRQYADRVAQTAAVDLLRQSDAKAPVDTGQLRGTGDVARRGVARFQVRYPADYASYTDTGTRPHVIRPRNARVLRFTVGSTTVFTRKVNHPGTRGTRWFADTFTDASWGAALRRAAQRTR